MKIPVVSSFLSFDLETTGTSYLRDRVVEVGVVGFRCLKVHEDGVDKAKWFVAAKSSQLVDPGVAIPAAATAVHGIDDAAVAGSPSTRSALLTLLPRLRGLVVGYNLVEYDLPLLLHECRRHGLVDEFYAMLDAVEIVDVMPYAVAGVKASKYRKGARTLGASTSRHGVELKRAHGAVDDAEATGLLALGLMAAGRMPQLGEAAEAARSTWAHLRRR